jgi:hypothetical protein
MNMENFAEYVTQERERLTANRVAALEARRQADQDLLAVEAEFRAIDAYEAAKSGKRIVHNGAGNGRRQRGSRREEILGVIQHSANGMKRREILETMGVKGDKSAEMSVSNALSALIKGGVLSRTEDGAYYPAMVPAEAEPVAA